MIIKLEGDKKVLVKFIPSASDDGANIPEGVQIIGAYAFLLCSGLTQLTLPNGITHIRAYAFRSCACLTQLALPNSITHIGQEAFADCSGLTQLNLPNSITHIGQGAFAGCSGLTRLTLPNGITHIGQRAFIRCTGLTQLTLPNGITHIEEGAFAFCTALTHIIIDTNDAKEFIRLKNLLPSDLRAHVIPLSIEVRQKRIAAQFNTTCLEMTFDELQGKTSRKNTCIFDANVKSNIISCQGTTDAAVQLKKALQAIRPIPGLPFQKSGMAAYEALLQAELVKHIESFERKHCAWRLQHYANIIKPQSITARAAHSTVFAASGNTTLSAQNPKSNNLTYPTLQKLIGELSQGIIPTLSDEEKQALQKPLLLNRSSLKIKEQLGLIAKPDPATLHTGQTPLAPALFSTPKQTKLVQEEPHTPAACAFQ